MLATGETYRDLGADYFTQRDPERQTKRLVKQLQRLGHNVTLTEGAARVPVVSRLLLVVRLGSAQPSGRGARDCCLDRRQQRVSD